MDRIRIKTLNSEKEVRKSIFRNFKKERVIDQTAFYLDTGADLFDRYYDPNKTVAEGGYDHPEITKMLVRILDKKRDSKVAIVSLGCGTCKNDRIIMEHLQKLGYDLPFFGVDSSMAMLYKAEDALKNATFEAHLICADFGAFDFKEELDRVVGDYDLKIYLFLGNTFGNLNQGYIADVLQEILYPGDYLLLDVGGFETITTAIKAKTFKRYMEYIEMPDKVEVYLYPIKAMGISLDDGQLGLEVLTDAATQAQVFKFVFKVKNPISCSLEGRKTNLSPNEQIDLLRILLYDFNKLIGFLEGRNFRFQEKLLRGFWNQFLFQKQ